VASATLQYCIAKPVVVLSRVCDVIKMIIAIDRNEGESSVS